MNFENIFAVAGKVVCVTGGGGGIGRGIALALADVGANLVINFLANTYGFSNYYWEFTFWLSKLKS